MNVAVILAGGIGSRVGADRPKQFIEVLNKPIIAYTLEAFQRNQNIDIIEIGCHSLWIDYLRNIIRKCGITKAKWIVEGGLTFQETTLNCVNNLSDKAGLDDLILIHYAAAPFVKQRIIDDSIKVGERTGCAVASIPCYQLIGSKDGNVSKKWIDRDKCAQIVSPYAFRYEFLLKVYQEAKSKNLLETIEPHITSLIYALGYELHLSYSDQTNIKITTKEDLELFDGWVRMNRARVERGEDWL